MWEMVSQSIKLSEMLILNVYSYSDETKVTPVIWIIRFVSQIKKLLNLDLKDTLHENFCL